MKIGLNATCMNDRPSGAKQRFEGIYRALVRRLPAAEFVLFEPADCRVGDWFTGAPNVTTRRTPLPSSGRLAKLAYGLGYWPARLREERFDIFECFNQPLVASPAGRTLTTIHDIRRVHKGWSLAERHLYVLSLRRALARADRVITVSEAMKAEILDFHPDARVCVVYNGIDRELFASVTAGDMERVRVKFGLPPQFILAVGHFERRKNYARLVETIALMRDRGTRRNLVIVGNDSGERSHIERLAASLGLAGQVKILSGLSDLEVRCVYKLSSLFVFPSSYEGFGIPVLEAMAAGVPSVLSDIPVFREITQDQGTYFPHDDRDALAHAIDAVLASESRRSELVDYGNRRVDDFSFDRIAARLAGVYASLAP